MFKTRKKVIEIFWMHCFAFFCLAAQQRQWKTLSTFNKTAEDRLLIWCSSCHVIKHKPSFFTACSLEQTVITVQFHMSVFEHTLSVIKQSDLCCIRGGPCVSVSRADTGVFVARCDAISSTPQRIGGFCASSEPDSVLAAHPSPQTDRTD